MFFREILDKTGTELADIFGVHDVCLWAYNESLAIRVTPYLSGHSNQTLREKLAKFSDPTSWFLRGNGHLALERLQPNAILLAVVQGRYIPPEDFSIEHAMALVDHSKEHCQEYLERLVSDYRAFPIKLEV